MVKIDQHTQSFMGVKNRNQISTDELVLSPKNNILRKALKEPWPELRQHIPLISPQELA